MSVSGISSSNLFDSTNTTIQTKMQQFQKEFQQLGQDLQSGNLSAAQSDFVTLQQMGTQSASSTSATQNNSPLAQAFNQLAQDLKSGNIGAAQQDFAQIQQAFQNQASQTKGHHHHHGGGGGEMSQLFDQLRQALQSGDLSSAQTAYNSLAQAFRSSARAASPCRTISLARERPPIEVSSSSGVSVKA